MKTNDIKKGTFVQLRNGWYARIEDNFRGNIRMATVWGYETEVGSVYSHDIHKVFPGVTTIDDALERTDWVDVEFTLAQLKLCKRVAEWDR